MQRTLRFAKYLPQFGWRPIVLTADAIAYDARANVTGNEVPPDLEVHRAFALDAARQISLFGRYPGFLTVPDRWSTWRYRAIPTAVRIIQKANVDAILSTFPIATAHSIGLSVAKRTGLPWIAEFRDPMWQGDYPPEPNMNRAWHALEADIFGQAKGIVVTTNGALTEYRDRFPHFDRSRLVLIENGYDEESFRRAETSVPVGSSKSDESCDPITLLHSGIIYREDRDPSALFQAIGSMKRRGLVSARDLQIILRASGSEIDLARELTRVDLLDIIRLEPAVGYIDALKEMLTVDGLLILQGSSCNAQVPAKLYEYLRAGRPIIALTDPSGDTALTLQRAGAGLMASLDSADQIQQILLQALEQIRNDSWRRCAPDKVADCSRFARTRDLAQLLDSVVAVAEAPA
jgi:hypothetical protein